MSEFLRYTIFGLAFAGIYFIAASGLVVTYTTSGIFNFAHGAVAMGTREEKTWSVLSHLSGFLNIFTLFLGPVAALVVWLVYRDRSSKVAFNALQSAAYQGAWLAILGIGWSLTILLTFVLVGFLLIPAMLILTVVPFAHMGYAAYKVSKDGEYRYPIVADLIENR